MTDPDRDRETVHETHRTTVVDTSGGGRRGGGLAIALVLIVALLALLFFLFGGGLNRAADEVGVDVNVDAPKVEVPDVNVKIPEKIEIDVPSVDVQREGNESR